MTLADALAQARHMGLDALDAQLLLLHLLGRANDRAWLRAHDTDEFPPGAAPAWEELCQRRLAGEPVAYLVGQKEFFGLPLAVDARVLVPRPDTETLVEWALELHGPAPLKVVDLGTGSGAIALALQHARPSWEVWAVDASAQALTVARTNATQLALPVRFHQGDWLSTLPGPFDLIVSNPPYIAEGDGHLPALRHEPQCALVSGRDGLDDLRKIIGQAVTRLAPGAWLLLEHGHDQSASVQTLLQAAGLTQACSRQDLAGMVRCTGARLPSPMDSKPLTQGR